MTTPGNTVQQDFLDMLETEPKKAAESFSIWARGKLLVAPPRQMRSIPLDEREDMIHDIIIHCIDDNMRRLRLYRKKPESFEALFFVIARNKIHDKIKMRVRGAKIANVDPEAVAVQPGNPNVAVNSPGAGMVLQLVARFLMKLDEKCQLLLRLAAHEHRPRELVKLLHMPAKKISNHTAHCARKLSDLLLQAGHDPEEMLSSIGKQPWE